MDTDQSVEILRLRATVKDLLALSIIPETWVGRQPPAIAADFADLLIELLDLDFAFVRLCDPTGCQVIEVTRGNSWKTFPEWLQQHHTVTGRISRHEIVANVNGIEESRCGIVVPIGVDSKSGLVAAASDRSGFPDQIDQQLLSLAANNAATAFQNAFLMNELRSAREALRNNEQELCKARDELESKVAERREALQSMSHDFPESKTKLEEAQRITHVGYWEWDLLTNQVNWSDETYRIYGLRPQERPMDFATVREKIHPQDWEFVYRAIEEALAGGVRFDIECRVLRPTGDVRILHSQGDVKRDASGQPYQMFGTTQDITERKHAEQALQRSQFYLGEGERLSHTASWAFNPLGFFEYWSQEMFRIYGVDPQNTPPTLEQHLEMIHPQDREPIAKTMKAMQARRCGCDMRHRIVRPDGEVRYVRCVGTPVIEGEILKGFLGTTMDVTEQEQLTRELERRQAYLALAQRLSHTGSFGWQVSTGAIYWSDETFRLFEIDPSTKPSIDMIVQRTHPGDRRLLQQVIDSAALDRKEVDLEYRVTVPNGSVKFLRVLGHPSTDESGSLEYRGVIMDVTDRKHSEEQRERWRQLEAELAHVNRVSMLGEMAASLAHEIKQPLTAAITSANTCIEWLAHQPPNLDRARAAAARIDKYGNRAAQIIDHMRSLYKKSPSLRELVDVNGIVHEIFSLLQGETSRYSIDMRLELAADLPKIKADRVQLQQVFMNLMLNAIEAMQESGGELTVRSQLQNGQLLFSVSDTGMGLPTDNIDQIFSAFFTTKTQGSGMGLAISSSIVESHGGRLWATANDGHGATFRFTLPTHVTE